MDCTPAELRELFQLQTPPALYLRYLGPEGVAKWLREEAVQELEGRDPDLSIWACRMRAAVNLMLADSIDPPEPPEATP
jgi:hypothetical protein